MKQNKLIARVALIGSMMLVGCEQAGNPPVSTLDSTPVPVDPAMQQRNWEPSPAIYARTGVMTRTTLFAFQSDTFGTQYSPMVTETPLFIANILAVPYALWETHSYGGPWKYSESRGETVEPTSSAMPPLPGSPQVDEPPPTAPPAPDVAPPAPPAPDVAPPATQPTESNQ